MCESIITPENFNPKVFYVCKRKFFDLNKPMKLHKHDFIELKYVFSGSSQHVIDDVVYVVKSGDIVICNPGVEHGSKAISDEPAIEFHVGITDVHLRSLCKNMLCSSGQVPVFHVPTNHRQEFVKCCYEMLLEHESKKIGNDLMIKSLVMKLLVLVFRELYPDEGNHILNNSEVVCDFESPTSKTFVVNTIISYFNENYTKKISLSKISQNMYLSPVYISKLFKEETGESPINYLIQLRLEKAKDVLTKNDDLSIKDIAKDVGYDDAYYFSKLFKKYYGVSPSQYKENALTS